MTLISVVDTRINRARNDCMSSSGIGDGSASLICSGQIVERTSGTVAGDGT